MVDWSSSLGSFRVFPEEPEIQTQNLTTVRVDHDLVLHEDDSKPAPIPAHLIAREAGRQSIAMSSHIHSQRQFKVFLTFSFSLSFGNLGNQCCIFFFF